MKRFIPVLMVMFLLMGVGSAAATPSLTISSVDAYNLLDTNSKAFLIDVRTVAQWQSGHAGWDPNNAHQNYGQFLEDPVQKVFNIPIYLTTPYFDPSTFNPLFDKAIRVEFPDKIHDILIFMCGSGLRAEAAAERVVSVLGYDYNQVFNFGTYNGWKNDPNFLPYNTGSKGAWDAAAVAAPLPGTILLVASGLLGLIGLARRQQ